MNDIRAQFANVDFSHDAETREERHELLASFLGAYADGELPAETHSQIDAHLTGCERCRSELEVHRALRERLGQQAVPAASSALRSRIEAGMKAATPPVFSAPASTHAEVAPSTRGVVPVWRAVVVGAAVLSAAFVGARAWSDYRSASRTISEATSRSAALLGNVLADYRIVMAGDLPGRERDLVAVRRAVPFAFAALSNPSLRLLGAWTTSLSGEPVAVLAYRWNDRVVLQYFVSEALLFQSPEIRAALAQKRAVSLTDGGQGIVLWAEPEYGTALVGDLRPEEFGALLESNRGR